MLGAYSNKYDTIVFYLFWDECYTREKLETMVVMQNWGEGGVNKVHYSLCENGK